VVCTTLTEVWPNMTNNRQDIATYKASLNADRQLHFEEILVGVGALCGSTFIDQNFDRWMAKKFGNFYTELDQDIRNPSSNFFCQFEEQKRGFTGLEHSRRIGIYPIHMAAPRSANYDKRNFTVYLEPYVISSGRDWARLILE
jgi:hypothetical protein